MATRKLSDVFAQHAEGLIEKARNGLPFTVLVSDSDNQALPKSFATKQEADRALDALPGAGMGGAVAEINPAATDRRLACTLYIRPAVRFGSFDT